MSANSRQPQRQSPSTDRSEHRWVRRPRQFGVFSRLGWGVTDQGVSSMSNFALGIVVARSLGSEGFGAFSLAYLTYAFFVSATRGLATDPLLVRYSGPANARWRHGVASSTATSAAAGAAAGAVCLLVALCLPSGIKGGFVALGVTLPALMLQDSWRFAFFSSGHPVKALVNDLVWGVLQMSVLVGLLLSGHATVVLCMLAFGGTAALAAAFGYWQTRVRPAPRTIRAWVVDQKDLGTRYLVENVTTGSARQVRMFVLGAVASLAAVGDTRAAEILMGPFTVLLMGASAVAVPEAATVLRRHPRRLIVFCFGLGAVLASTAAVWGVVILALLPTGLGDLLLGPIWVPASALLPPVVVIMFMGGFGVAASAGVRALAAARRGLSAQLVNSSIYVVGGCAGALVDGARGSCWGVALGAIFGAANWWVQLRRGVRDHLNQVSGDAPQLHNPERIAT